MLKCAVCGAVKSDETKLFQCSSCKSVAYCSVDHQKKDWPNHRKSCSLVSIQIQQVEIEPENRNRSEKEFKTVAVASRDFKQGEIILDERPLFNVPVPHCCGPALTAFDSIDVTTDLQLFKRDTSIRDRQCLTCGDIVKMHQKCSTCSAPICSPECEKAPVHAENECAALSSGTRPLKFGKHSGGDGNCPMKKVILIRIGSIKKNQPEIWEAVKSLVDPKLKFTDDYKLLKWIMDHQGFDHFDGSISETQDDLGKGGGDFSKISCLYKIGGQIEHSCAPNCVKDFGDFPDFKMRAWAAVPIKKGEILTISRLPREVADQGTVFRRIYIMRHFNFTCQCKLCSDVTECGSFQSAVTCTRCLDSPAQSGKQDAKEEEKKSEGKLYGYLLPVNSDSGAKWSCGSCGLEKSEAGIIKFFRSMKHYISPVDPFSFVDSQKKLHPNHFLILKPLKVYVHQKTQKAVRREDEVQYTEILKFLDTSKFLLDIYDKTQPGVSTVTVQVQGLAAGYMLSILNALVPTETPSVSCTNKYLKMAEECERYLRNGQVFHQNEFLEKGRKRNKTLDNIMEHLETLKGLKQKILLG